MDTLPYLGLKKLLNSAPPLPALIGAAFLRLLPGAVVAGVRFLE